MTETTATVTEIEAAGGHMMMLEGTLSRASFVSNTRSLLPFPWDNASPAALRDRSFDPPPFVRGPRPPMRGGMATESAKLGLPGAARPGELFGILHVRLCLTVVRVAWRPLNVTLR